MHPSVHQQAETISCPRLIGILFLLLSASLAHADDTPNKAPFVTYSWSQPEPAQPHIIPFHWIRLKDLEDWDRFINDTKAALDEKPEGHRVLFTWDLQRTMGYQRHGDFLYTPDGRVAGCNAETGFKPYRSLWWDNGVRRTRKLFDRLFKAYAEAGGKLDILVMNYEVGLSYWHLKAG